MDDLAGATVGYDGVNEVNDIDGASVIRTFTGGPRPAWEDTAPRMFTLPPSLRDFVVRLVGRAGGTGETSLSVVAPGLIVDVAGAIIPAGEEDQLTVLDLGGTVVYTSQDGDLPAITVAVELPDGRQIAIEVDVSTAEGLASLSVSLDRTNSEADVQLPDGDTQHFKVRVLRSSPESDERIEVVGEAPGGSTLTIGAGVWDQGDPLPIVVDSDGDGFVDDTLLLDGCGGTDACSLFGDRDGDGIADADDNCPDTFDRDGFDTDDDGQGDACDKDGVVVPVEGEGEGRGEVSEEEEEEVSEEEEEPVGVDVGDDQPADRGEGRGEGEGEGGPDPGALACGMAVISDVTLEEDLDCSAFEGDSVFIITTSGVTVDGGGFQVITTGATGVVRIDGADDVTVRNLVAHRVDEDATIGITVKNADRLQIEGVEVAGRGWSTGLGTSGAERAWATPTPATGCEAGPGRRRCRASRPPSSATTI